MPAFNVEDYIKVAIESILKQSYRNIELLIVDDGSKDKTWKIINEQPDIRVKKFRFTKNRGNVAALNFLLERANGDFIAFQDADDWSAPKRITSQVEFIENHPNISLCGTEYRYVNFDDSLEQLKELPLTNDSINQFIKKEKIPPFCAASCMIKKEVYESIGGLREYFDGIGAADFDWHFRIVEKYEVANLPEILYFYRKNINSITFTVSKNLNKMISHKIAYYLHQQRIANGSDALINKNLEDLKDFSKKHLPEYFADPSLIYNKIAMSFIHKGELGIAFKNVLIGIVRRPLMKKNYSLLKYWFWKRFVNNVYDRDSIRQV